MTIINETSAYNIITTTGGETALDYTFPIFDEDYIKVQYENSAGVKTDLIIGTNYTVSGVGQQAGGTINLVTGASAGKYYLIQNTPYQRVTDFQEAGDFFARDLNEELDLQEQQIQQLSREVNRSVRVDYGQDTEEFANEVSRIFNSIDNIDTCADNITDIQNASTNAQTATTKASEATSSASSASTSSQTATTQAGIATTKASEASASATEAAESAGLAANSVTLAQEWATKMDGQVASTDYSSKYYAGQSGIEADRAATEASKAIGLEIGSLISSSLPILNAVKYVLADGTQYSRTGVYKAFADYLAQVKLTHPQCFVTQAEFDADVASTGQCGRYVLDTVNFRVPRITRFIGATVNLADIGKAWSESLPNVKGGYANSTNGETGLGSATYGAFYVDQSGYKNAAQGNNNGYIMRFDASRSSSTYQDGAKVNPERVTYPYYIVVSNAGQMTPVEIDINQVLNELALKADKDLDNTIPSQAFKEQSVGWGMPDYTAGVSKTWNTNITAEKDGVVIANATADQSTTLKAIVNGNQLPYNELANYGILSISFAVSKGDTYKVYGANGTGTIVFYPFKGVK